MSCVFCGIVAKTAPAQIVTEWEDAIAVVPLRPVTKGHVLVISNRHVRGFTEDPVVSAATMGRAAELAQGIGGQMNLITSDGANATQSIFHLHFHLVPRHKGDGLALPWTGRSKKAPKYPPSAPEGVIRVGGKLAMTGILMKCGHTAQGLLTRGDKKIPACIICMGTGRHDDSIVVDDAPPSLDGRTSRCGYYQDSLKGCAPQRNHRASYPSETPSSLNLPFFEHLPDEAFDRHYCGCFGWD